MVVTGVVTGATVSLAGTAFVEHEEGGVGGETTSPLQRISRSSAAVSDMAAADLLLEAAALALAV